MTNKGCEARVNRAKRPNTRGFKNFGENPAKNHNTTTRNRREYKPPHITWLAQKSLNGSVFVNRVRARLDPELICPWGSKSTKTKKRKEERKRYRTRVASREALVYYRVPFARLFPQTKIASWSVKMGMKNTRKTDISPN